MSDLSLLMRKITHRKSQERAKALVKSEKGHANPNFQGNLCYFIIISFYVDSGIMDWVYRKESEKY